jgi:aspartate racemase
MCCVLEAVNDGPRWRTIGILGGMGPAASADFLTMLVGAVGAAHDEAHPRVLLDSNPYVPDRNAAAMGQGAAPGPVLAAMAAQLLANGAKVLAMPCNAAHGWADAVRAVLPEDRVFVDLIEAGVAATLACAPKRVGLMAVGATHRLRLYHAPLAAAGVEVLSPPADAVAALVARVKGGDTGPAARAAAARLAVRLAEDGADVVLAACTEVPLVLDGDNCPVPLVDATAALVAATLRAADLRPEVRAASMINRRNGMAG